MLSSRKLRKPRTATISLAGAGAIAVVHSLAARSAGLRVVAVASRNGTSARHLAGNLDARKVSMDALPAGTDLMIVATPPASHEALVLSAIGTPTTVLVEKPLTTTLTSADRIISSASDAPARIFVAENLLHSPQFRRASELRSTMRELTHLSARTVQPSPTWGHFNEPLEAGGVLFDLGPHPVALVLALADEVPTWVSAELRSSRADGADDHAKVLIGFDSGLVAEIETAWVAEQGAGSDAEVAGAADASETHWAIQAASTDAVVRLEFSPEPMVEFNGEPQDIVPVHEVVDPRLESLGYVDQLIDVTDPGSNHSQSLEDARAVLEVICAAYASAGQDGARVGLPFDGDRNRTPMELWRG